MTFSEQLRRAIEADPRSRYCLCKESGMSPAAMSRFMNGQAGLTTTSLDAILPVLGLELKPTTTRKRKGKKCRPT